MATNSPAPISRNVIANLGSTAGVLSLAYTKFQLTLYDVLAGWPTLKLPMPLARLTLQCLPLLIP